MALPCLWQRNREGLPLRLGFQGTGKEVVAGSRFFRGHATGKLRDGFPVFKFIKEGGPHLQDGVGETGLENTAGNRFVGHFVPHVDDLPRLLFALLVVEYFQRIDLLAAPAG